MDGALTVLGTHALYAYEAMAGVWFAPGLLATGDVDLMFDARREVKIVGDVGEVGEVGLLGVLKKVDASYELAGRGHLRAINADGFMVELVKPMPENTRRIERMRLTEVQDDLTAVEIEHLSYLADAPATSVIVIAENGLPLKMRVPNPRDFALNKLWTSHRADRDAVKVARDRAQALAVARLCVEHLGFSFEPPAGRLFPSAIRDEMRSRFPLRSNVAVDTLDGVPGFGVPADQAIDEGENAGEEPDGPRIPPD